jgi:DNA-binding transcriptional LysR family regulator
VADDFDWDDLRYFLRAVQSKTLAGAAREMGVDHTTVGRRLLALERALGAPLFIRKPDGLQPTPLGARMAPLVEQVASAVHGVQHLATQQKARVRLAVPTGFTALFTAALARLRDAHPDITLEMLSGSRLVDLGKGEAELAIRSGPIDDEELVARRVGVAGWSLYASPAYLARRPGPVEVDDLSGHHLIGYDASLAALPATQWIERHAPPATIVLRSREMTDMLAATVSGAGIAALSCLVGDAEPALVRLTPRVIASRGLSLVYRREMRLAGPVRAVIRFVVEVMRENADRVAGVRGDG